VTVNLKEVTCSAQPQVAEGCAANGHQLVDEQKSKLVHFVRQKKVSKWKIEIYLHFAFQPPRIPQNNWVCFGNFCSSCAPFSLAIHRDESEPCIV